MADRTREQKDRLRQKFNTDYREVGAELNDIKRIREFINRNADVYFPFFNPPPYLANANDTYNLLGELYEPQQFQPPKIKDWNIFRSYDYTYVNIETDEDLYKIVKEKILEIGDITSVVFYFLKNVGNEIRKVSITADVLDLGYDAFIEQLYYIITGSVAGSDRWVGIPDDTYTLSLDRFTLRKIRIQANGKSDKMIFKVVGIAGNMKGKDATGRKITYNNCSTLALEALGYTPKQDAEALSDLKNLIAEIKDNELPINIITNSFTLRRSFSDIINSSPKKRNLEIKDAKGNIRPNVCSPVSLETDIDPVYIHRVNHAEHTLIYDEINKHTDIILGNDFCKATPELCDDVYLTLSCKVIKDNKILFTPTQVNKNNLANTEVKDNSILKYVFFDYETCINWDKSSCMEEYSLSILVLDDDELQELNRADADNNINKVAEMRKRCCRTFLGFNCSEEFIKWILENENNTQFIFIGFNNSNFDNFLFLDALLRNQNKYYDDYCVSDIFYNGNTLLNFQINGRHTTFDIRKHLTGSLKYNCNSFKINCCSKKDFNHEFAQDLYNKGELIDWINNNEELKEYNEYDVLATAVLYERYRKALQNINATNKYALRLYETKTIGSLIFKVFDAHAKKNKYDFTKLSLERYKDLRKYKIAGRVEMFNGVQKVIGRMVSTDVCSLYPFVMSVLDCYYPVGATTDTDEYMGDDVIGFYYCDIDQSNLKKNNLPKIYARKTEIENDWGSEEVLQDYLVSNVMIRLLRERGCRVVIKNGFYWKNEVKSCEMFKFLLDFMSEKNKQDELKSQKDLTYNPALRETLKLLMNSLSGKVIEGLHTEKTSFVESVEEYLKKEKEAVKINTINEIGNKTFITYEMDESKLIAKQKPIYLGVLIYDYAKEYMYNYSYGKIGLDKLFYTDTDATKFQYSRFLEWKKWVEEENVIVPHHEEVELIDPRYKNHLIYQPNSKVFGSFEDELEDMVGNEYKFYCLEKKSWCYSVDGKSKYRFKGINDNAQILEGNEKILSAEKKLSVSEKDVNEFYINNKHNAIGGTNPKGNNQERFFDKLFKDGEIYVLTSSFRKLVKNNNRNVDYDEDGRFNTLMNKVQVKYVVKKLSIKN